NILTQTIIILITTVAFVVSATRGVNKGIRYLSMANVVIAIALMVFVFIFDSCLQMIESFMTNTGSYIQNLASTACNMNAVGGGRRCLNGWTLFYWAWWVRWAGFVGSSIAPVSRGRTIREFILDVTGVPVLFCAIWFAILGVAGIKSDNLLSGRL